MRLNPGRRERVGQPVSAAPSRSLACGSAILQLQRSAGNAAVAAALQRDDEVLSGFGAARGKHTLFDKHVPTSLRNKGIAGITTNHVIPYNHLKKLATKVKEAANVNPDDQTDEQAALVTEFKGLLGEATAGAYELRGTRRALAGEDEGPRSPYLDFTKEQYTSFISSGATPEVKAPDYRKFGIKNKKEAGAKVAAGMSNRLNEMFTWMPWNLFKGPVNANRFDDPGEGFEVNAEPIIGNRTFTSLQMADEAIEGEPIEAVKNLRAAKASGQKGDVIPFNPSQWISVYEHLREVGELTKVQGTFAALPPGINPGTAAADLEDAAMEKLDAYLRLAKMTKYAVSDGIIKKAVLQARDAATARAAEKGYGAVSFPRLT